MKNLKIKNYLLTCAVLFLFAAPVFAAEFKINTDSSAIGIGQQFEVRLILDTQGRAINAVEGKVNFSPDFLELKEIRSGQSIINLWVEKPAVSGSEINFSGITPGGYNGQNGQVFSLVFEAKKEGKADISIENVKALLNDGQGTEDAVAVKNLEFKIEKTGNAFAPAISDRDLPENFKPLIGRDKNIFDGKWFLSFATEDKGSGIDYYQVQERWFSRPDQDKWRKTDSPYLPKDQLGINYVFVRAVDKAGNERIVAVSPRIIPVYKLFIIFGIIMAVIGILKIRRTYGGKNTKNHQY